MRTELPHNTPEQVRTYLREALAIIEDIDPPGDLRAVAFQQALSMVAAKQIMFEQVQPGILGLNHGGR